MQGTQYRGKRGNQPSGVSRVRARVVGVAGNRNGGMSGRVMVGLSFFLILRKPAFGLKCEKVRQDLCPLSFFKRSLQLLGRILADRIRKGDKETG